MEEEGLEGSEKQAVAAKKLARCGSKIAAGTRGRSTPGHGRRWSSATDLDIETPTPWAAGGAAAAVLGRSYSTAAAVAAAVDGGVKQQQAAPEGEGEGEHARPRRRCGAGARLSRKMKEHRARFYIMRRCIAMLICWRDDPDE